MKIGEIITIANKLEEQLELRIKSMEGNPFTTIDKCDLITVRLIRDLAVAVKELNTK